MYLKIAFSEEVNKKLKTLKLGEAAFKKRKGEALVTRQIVRTFSDSTMKRTFNFESLIAKIDGTNRELHLVSDLNTSQLPGVADSNSS